MSMPLWFYNLAVYCAQFAILIAAGALMVAVTRLREPRLQLIYWQVLLAIGALLPAFEPWQTASQIEQGMIQAGGGVALAGRAGIEAASALPAQAASSLSIYEIVAILLVAGLLIRLLWLAAGLVRLRRSRLHGRPLGPHAAMEQIKAVLGVSPAVLVSDRISSPVTFGWHSPRVLLPQGFIQMEEARQRVILCHEFLHVRRRDWVWHVGEEIFRSFFWFHFAVVWLVAQIRLCREQLVDREVVVLTGSRRDYLDALFEIASSSRTSRYAPALLFLSERHLKRRVTLILKEVTVSRKKLALALSASLGGLLLTGAIAATLLPLRTSAAQASSAVSPKTPTVRPDTHFYGNPHARVTVVEFGDFECPACREAASAAERVRKNMGSQVRFAYRQFPLARVHYQAEKAAEAAECAAEQGKFWQAVNYLSDHPLDFSSAGVRKFAASVGLDEGRTMRCLSSGAMAARVQEDIRDGRALGVRSVPTFFIGNTRVVGLQSYSQLHALIEQKLRAEGNVQSAAPNLPSLLSAASLAPTFAGGFNSQASAMPSQRSEPGTDPPTHFSQNASANTNDNHKAYVNQEEIQRQVDEAMKQAKIAQEAASKIAQKKLQKRIEEAMKRLKMAEAVAPKIDQAKINQQIEQAMKQVQMSKDISPKIDQKKLQEQIDQDMKQLKMAEAVAPKIDKAKIKQQIENAMKQAMIAQETAPKIDQQKLQEQIDQAMKQAKLAQESATKMNKAEIRRQVQQAREQARAAHKEAEEARKEAQKLREQLKKERLELQKQRQAAKPSPHAEPKPAPVSPKEAAPPPPTPPAPPSSDKLPPTPPPASPVPPAKPPEAAAIVGGVPGGVVVSVPGGKVTGVPGGVVGGVITVPQPPNSASQSPQVAAPPALSPTSPALPLPPQN
jgi:protein-disulfide isomerase